MKKEILKKKKKAGPLKNKAGEARIVVREDFDNAVSIWYGDAAR